MRVIVLVLCVVLRFTSAHSSDSVTITEIKDRYSFLPLSKTVDDHVFFFHKRIGDEAHFYLSEYTNGDIRNSQHWKIPRQKGDRLYRQYKEENKYLLITFNYYKSKLSVLKFDVSNRSFSRYDHIISKRNFKYVFDLKRKVPFVKLLVGEDKYCLIHPTKDKKLGVSLVMLNTELHKVWQQTCLSRRYHVRYMDGFFQKDKIIFFCSKHTQKNNDESMNAMYSYSQLDGAKIKEENVFDKNQNRLFVENISLQESFYLVSGVYKNLNLKMDGFFFQKYNYEGELLSESKLENEKVKEEYLKVVTDSRRNFGLAIQAVEFGSDSSSFIICEVLKRKKSADEFVSDVILSSYFNAAIGCYVSPEVHDIKFEIYEYVVLQFDSKFELKNMHVIDKGHSSFFGSGSYAVGRIDAYRNNLFDYLDSWMDEENNLHIYSKWNSEEPTNNRRHVIVDKETKYNDKIIELDKSRFISIEGKKDVYYQYNPIKHTLLIYAK